MACQSRIKMLRRFSFSCQSRIIKQNGATSRFKMWFAPGQNTSRIQNVTKKLKTLINSWFCSSGWSARRCRVRVVRALRRPALRPSLPRVRYWYCDYVLFHTTFVMFCQWWNGWHFTALNGAGRCPYFREGSTAYPRVCTPSLRGLPWQVDGVSSAPFGHDRGTEWACWRAQRPLPRVSTPSLAGSTVTLNFDYMIEERR